MMAKFYYYNKHVDSKGNHEVHSEDCSYLPNYENRIMIGYENNCKSAIERAKRETGKTNFDGCWHCSFECHIG